jgi:hypothetical protein
MEVIMVKNSLMLSIVFAISSLSFVYPGVPQGNDFVIKAQKHLERSKHVYPTNVEYLRQGLFFYYHLRAENMKLAQKIQGQLPLNNLAFITRSYAESILQQKIQLNNHASLVNQLKTFASTIKAEAIEKDGKPSIKLTMTEKYSDVLFIQTITEIYKYTSTIPFNPIRLIIEVMSYSPNLRTPDLFAIIALAHKETINKQGSADLYKASLNKLINHLSKKESNKSSFSSILSYIDTEIEREMNAYYRLAQQSDMKILEKNFNIVCRSLAQHYQKAVVKVFSEIHDENKNTEEPTNVLATKKTKLSSSSHDHTAKKPLPPTSKTNSPEKIKTKQEEQSPSLVSAAHNIYNGAEQGISFVGKTVENTASTLTPQVYDFYKEYDRIKRGRKALSPEDKKALLEISLFDSEVIQRLRYITTKEEFNQIITEKQKYDPNNAQHGSPSEYFISVLTPFLTANQINELFKPATKEERTRRLQDLFSLEKIFTQLGLSSLEMGAFQSINHHLFNDSLGFSAYTAYDILSDSNNYEQDKVIKELSIQCAGKYLLNSMLQPWIPAEVPFASHILSGSIISNLRSNPKNRSWYDWSKHYIGNTAATLGTSYYLTHPITAATMGAVAAYSPWFIAPVVNLFVFPFVGFGVNMATQSLWHNKEAILSTTATTTKSVTTGLAQSGWNKIKSGWNWLTSGGQKAGQPA